MDRIELIRHHQLFQYEDRAWALSRHRHSCPAPSSSLFFFCWDGTMQSVDVGWLSQQVGTETGSIGRQILAATRCRQKWEESEGLLKRETAETVRSVWGRLEFLFFFYQRQQTFQPFLERTTMNIHLPVVKALAAELDWLIDVRE